MHTHLHACALTYIRMYMYLPALIVDAEQFRVGTWSEFSQSFYAMIVSEEVRTRDIPLW